MDAPLTYQLTSICACLIFERRDRARRSVRKEKKKEEKKPDIVAHTLIPALRELKQVDFEASLVYTENSRTT